MTGRPPGVRQSLIRAWDGPAVTWTGLLILAPGMVITDAVFAEPVSMHSFAAAVLSYAALVAVIELANVLVLRRMPAGRTRRVAVLGAFVAGALARISVSALLMPPHGIVAVEPWMLPRLASTVVWLNVAAILVDWERRHAALLAARNAELTRLARTTAVVDAELEHASEELAEVQGRVMAELRRLSAQLDRPKPDLQGIIDKLDAAVDGLVRPASHDLASHPEGVHELVVAAQRPRWFEQAASIARAWPSAAPFQPAAVALITLPIALAAVLARGLDARSVLEFGAVAVQVAAVATAAWLLAPALRRMPTGLGMATTATAYAALLVMGTELARVTSGDSGEVLAEVALLPWIATVATGGAVAMSAHWAEAARERDVLLEETRWRRDRANQQLWAQRRRLAIILHGRVQAGLTSCALLLRAAATEPGGHPELIDRVRRALGELNDLADESANETVRNRLADLAATWEGVAAVSIECQAAAERMLDEDHDSADAVVEAVRELLLNAVRHGMAGAIRVRLDQCGVRAVCVEVQETREAPASSAPATAPGVGLVLLQSFTSGLEISDRGTSRTTRVVVPTAG